MIMQIVHEKQQGKKESLISKKFHNTLVAMTVAIAHQVRKSKVVLRGRCFQHLSLTEEMIARVTAEGFSFYTHQRVSPHDGCIALGQVMIASSP